MWLIPESQGDNNMDEIDLDAVDDSIQVKMYACMLKAKHQQETERRRRGIDDNHNEKKISDESDKQRVLKEKESNDTKNNNTKVINDNLGKSDYDLHPKLYRVEDPFNSEEYYERYDAEDDNTKFNEKHLKYINLSRMDYWIDWDENNNRGHKTQHFAFMDYSYIKCRAKRGSGAKSRPTLFGLYIKGILFEDTKEKYFGSFRINTDRLNEEGKELMTDMAKWIIERCWKPARNKVRVTRNQFGDRKATNALGQCFMDKLQQHKQEFAEKFKVAYNSK